MTMTKNEEKIILILRSLKAFERVEISADQQGRIDYFIVHRSFKEILAHKE